MGSSFRDGGGWASSCLTNGYGKADSLFQSLRVITLSDSSVFLHANQRKGSSGPQGTPVAPKTPPQTDGVTRTHWHIGCSLDLCEITAVWTNVSEGEEPCSVLARVPSSPASCFQWWEKFAIEAVRNLNSSHLKSLALFSSQDQTPSLWGPAQNGE